MSTGSMSGHEPQNQPTAVDPVQAEAQAQEDLNLLLGTGLGIAQEQLDAHGAFLPLGLVIDSGGEVRMVAVAPDGVDDDGAGQDAELDADAMVGDLYRLLTEQKDGNRAAAVISDVHLPEEDSDAIHVASEHSEGLAVSVLLPYAEAGDGSGRNYGELIGEEGEHNIWA
jgi:hypothetical protein